MESTRGGTYFATYLYFFLALMVVSMFIVLFSLFISELFSLSFVWSRSTLYRCIVFATSGNSVMQYIVFPHIAYLCICMVIITCTVVITKNK